MTTVPKFSIGLYLPDVLTPPTVASAATYELNATTDELQIVLQPPADGNITGLGFFTGAITTGSVLKGRIETLDATGQTSGTLWATNTEGNTSGAVAANTWYDITLTANATVSRDDMLGVVVKYASGSTPGALRLSYFTDGGSTYSNFPKLIEDDGTAAYSAGGPIIALNYNGTYHFTPGIFVMSSIGTYSFSTSTAKDTCGMKFQIPFSGRICGCDLWLDLTGDCTLYLLDSSNNVLSSIAIDKDTGSAASGAPVGIFHINFDAYALAANTDYRLVLRATSATSLSQYYQTLQSAALRGAAHPLGVNCCFTEADYGAGPSWGAWTDTSTQVTFLNLWFDGIETGGAGVAALVGGSLVRP